MCVLVVGKVRSAWAEARREVEAETAVLADQRGDAVHQLWRLQMDCMEAFEELVARGESAQALASLSRTVPYTCSARVESGAVGKPCAPLPAESPSAVSGCISGSATDGVAGAGHDAALPQLHCALEQARQAYRQQYQQLHDVRTEERRLRSEVRAHERVLPPPPPPFFGVESRWTLVRGCVRQRREMAGRAEKA